MLNLFANAIRVQQITNKLQKLTGNSTEDTLAKLYYTGLLINILTVFEPPSDAGDLDLDLGEEDFLTMLLRNLPLRDDHVDDFGGSTTPVSP